ncbi:MAG: hypothetical protein PF638_09275 [Candidatus Delongbacteria bacterium]|jgi:hypothetical protein|nr:hypothetical protein [Candidatus Delongbacteria bacterium]
MKRITYLLLLVTTFIFPINTDLIHVGSISFEDITWLEIIGITYEDAQYSNQRVSSQVFFNKAVILYFFDLEIC